MANNFSVKICVEDGCLEVAHNCSDENKYCNNCGKRMIRINQKTYEKSFSWRPNQFDYSTKNPKETDQDLQRVDVEKLGYKISEEKFSK